MRIKSAGIIVLILALAFAASAQDRPAKITETQFADGHILSVMTATSGHGATYLEDAELAKLGETWFVTGKMINVPEMPALNNVGRTWIPLNFVTLMMEYKDADEVRKALAAAKNPR